MLATYHNSPQLTTTQIKCPFKGKLYGKIAGFYYDQIQFGMWLLGAVKAYFFVFTTKNCCLETYDYNKEYCEKFLVPAVERFYFNRFLPLLLLQKHGVLVEDEVTIPEDIIVEPVFWDHS